MSRARTQEVFGYLSAVKDPEYPMTLDELSIISLTDVAVDRDEVRVALSPTIPACSQVSKIALSVLFVLQVLLPARFRLRVSIKPGTHVQEAHLNKLMFDFERLQAALEVDQFKAEVFKLLDLAVLDRGANKRAEKKRGQYASAALRIAF